MFSFGAWLGVFVIIAAAIFAFEIWMFVEVVRNPRLSDSQRLLWCLGMLLLHPFVAMAYYVLEYQNRPR